VVSNWTPPGAVTAGSSFSINYTVENNGGSAPYFNPRFRPNDGYNMGGAKYW
jgi:hypothetical protein